jgi:small basic protein
MEKKLVAPKEINTREEAALLFSWIAVGFITIGILLAVLSGFTIPYFITPIAYLAIPISSLLALIGLCYGISAKNKSDDVKIVMFMDLFILGLNYWIVSKFFW